MTSLRLVFCCTVLLASVALGNSQPEVTNVTAVQRPHTALVDVTYDLFDADGDATHVTLWYSLDGGMSWDHQCQSVWGDVGDGVVSGEGLMAGWDAGTDLEDLIGSQFSIRVYADDGGGDVEVPEGFVYIPPGTFTMGSPTDEPGRDDNETQHPVTLTQGFYMSQDEVTEAWWSQVMGGVPTDPQLPKNGVSWDMAVEFCNALSTLEGLDPAYTIHGSSGDVTWNRDANGYRLPTEAEWEYACRSGSTTAFANGPLNGSIYCGPEPNLDAMGWYCGNNSPGGTKPVGLKQPNGWGLHDMHGNVYEWVWDGYRDDYEVLPPVDPVHDVDPGFQRALRGGHYSVFALFCRSADRIGGLPHTGNGYQGFRPVRSAP